MLAKNWKRLSKEQQGDFVEEFTRYLANDYGKRLDRYEQEKVEITGERDEPRGDITVKTKIVGGANDGALVDYRMRNRENQWKIIDVTIEGISLVANFRDQFREVMGSGGARQPAREVAGEERPERGVAGQLSPGRARREFSLRSSVTRVGWVGPTPGGPLRLAVHDSVPGGTRMLRLLLLVSDAGLRSRCPRSLSPRSLHSRAGT